MSLIRRLCRRRPSLGSDLSLDPFASPLANAFGVALAEAARRRRAVSFSSGTFSSRQIKPEVPAAPACLVVALAKMEALGEGGSPHVYPRTTYARGDRAVKYILAFKPRARKDLKALGSENLQRVLEKIEALTDNLAGDVKRLTDYTPEFRLRVGDYRVLFEIDGSTIIVYRVVHRRQAYR